MKSLVVSSLVAVAVFAAGGIARAADPPPLPEPTATPAPRVVQPPEPPVITPRGVEPDASPVPEPWPELGCGGPLSPVRFPAGATRPCAIDIVGGASEADRLAIAAVRLTYETSLGSDNAAAAAACYTPDGLYAVGGRVLVNRTAIRSQLAERFVIHPVVSASFLPRQYLRRNDVVIEVGTWTLRTREGGRDVFSRQNYLSEWVMTTGDDGRVVWRMRMSNENLGASEIVSGAW